MIIDTDTLNTLPDRELSAGLAEVIKYGLIRDPAFFVWLEQHLDRLLKRDPDALAEAIERSCRNKAEVVATDEREAGVRATLNLGHTFGHAIETGMGYGAWLHGEAVAAGMAMAADLSRRLGWLKETDLARIRALLERAPAGAGTTKTFGHTLARTHERGQEGAGRQTQAGIVEAAWRGRDHQRRAHGGARRDAQRRPRRRVKKQKDLTGFTGLRRINKIKAKKLYALILSILKNPVNPVHFCS